MMRKRDWSYIGSIEFWIFIVVCVYFGYAIYFLIYGLGFSIQLASDAYVYNLISQNPWWWAILYYGSESLAGAIGLSLRVIGGVFALHGACLFWKKKDAAQLEIKRRASVALLMEAGFYLSFIPSIIAAFAYNLSTERLFYFDHTPPQLLLYGTAIPCLAMALVIPPFLLKLRAKVMQNAPNEEIIKWSCLACVAYVFAAFWFNYSMLWVAAMVPYPHAQGNYEFGADFLFKPINFASFVMTVFGLFAVATAALATTLPAIRKRSTKLSRRSIGAVVTAFGSYFLFNTLVYFLAGGYEAHPSVWYEVIGPLHNPNLWCTAFIFLGIAALVHSQKEVAVTYHKGKFEANT
ncbi:MAG: hypothetical protein QXD19_05600 [Candidatus Bathyarchaeia archaeon]